MNYKTMGLLMLAVALLAACEVLTPTPGVPGDSGLVGVAPVVAVTGAAIPSLEQAKVGKGGPIPEDVQGYIDLSINIVTGNVPSAAEFAGKYNGGAGDAVRYVVFSRDAQGNVLWSEASDYPIVWDIDQKGNISGVRAGQKFFAVPDSKNAQVIFAGQSEKAGVFGEKPALVRTPVTVTGADGQPLEYFLEYFDLQVKEWRPNEAVLKAMTPLGGAFAVWQAEDGQYYAGAEDVDGNRQAMLAFDLDQKVWVEYLPALPQEMPPDFASEITTYQYPFKWESNTLYVDWQDGQGLRQSGTYDPGTKEWNWQYFVYGGPALDLSERNQLIEKTGFSCSGFFDEPTCVSLAKDTLGGNDYIVEGIFTGRRSVHRFIDPAGNVTGTQVDFEILTLDKDGKPICFWTPLQIEIDKLPGQNLYGFVVSNFDPLQRKTVIALHELFDIFPRGMKIFRSFRDTVEYMPEGNLRKYIFESFYNDPHYIKLLKAFLGNRGIDTGSSFLFSTGGFFQ